MNRNAASRPLLHPGLLAFRHEPPEAQNLKHTFYLVGSRTESDYKVDIRD